MYTFLEKTQDYKQGVSGSSETVHTGIENDFVLWKFADLFHAQTAALHSKESWKCKKA